MPRLDVSRVLINPILIDSFSVIRRQEIVNNFGISTIMATTTPSIAGVVFASDENDLKRLPDLQIQAKCITVITLFALRGESEIQGTSFQPDVVVWNGDNFVVRVIEDFINYGAGYIKAICTSIDLVDQPPTPHLTSGFGVSGYGTEGYGE